MPIIYALILITALVFFYSYSMAENKKTEMPEGCQQLLAGCASCHDVTCGHFDSKRKVEN